MQQQITPSLIPDQLLTKNDVAQIAQVSTRHVGNLVASGRLPRPIRLGAHPRWRRAELLAFLEGLEPSAPEEC